jgi:hypothetical protein
MKQLENSKETHYVFVGDTDCNISTSCGAPITLKVKGTILLVTGPAELIPWPPRFPVLTLCGFYTWGYAEDQVYQPPMPQSLRERKWPKSSALLHMGHIPCSLFLLTYLSLQTPIFHQTVPGEEYTGRLHQRHIYSSKTT